MEKGRNPLVAQELDSEADVLDPVTEMAAGLQGYLGYMIRRAQLLIFQDVNHVLESFDLRPTLFSMLFILSEKPGLRQSAVADMLGVQRTNLVKMVDGLEQRGLLSRQPSPEDRRSYALHLTDAGHQFLEEVCGAVNAHEQRLTDVLGREDRDELLRLLTRVVREFTPRSGASDEA